MKKADPGAEMMGKTVAGLLIATLLLSGCGTVRDSRLNPFNWFGSSREVKTTQAEGEVNPLIPTRSGLFRRRVTTEVDLTTPVDQVTELRVERIPGGAIIRATGIDPVQGAYDVRLVPVDPEERAVKGVLSYRLQRQLPAARRGGPEQTRRMVAARRVTDRTLRGVRSIRVEGARNARAVRR